MYGKLLETQMEELIIQFPEYYLKENGLKLIKRQFRIGKYIFDLLFEDRQGYKLIVEIQRGVLDRDHTYKIFDYFDEYKSQHLDDFIDILLVANEVTSERKKMLTIKGVKYLEIPELEFLKKLEKKDNNQNEVNNSSETIKVNQAKDIKTANKTERGNHFYNADELKTRISDYIRRGKQVQDKIARRNIITDILKEYEHANDRYITAQHIFNIIKNGNYQKDYCNSFFRVIFYYLLVSDELLEGKNIRDKIYDDVRTEGNKNYPKFKLLDTDKFDLSKIKVRLNFSEQNNYKRMLDDITNFTKDIKV